MAERPSLTGTLRKSDRRSSAATSHTGRCQSVCVSPCAVTQRRGDTSMCVSPPRRCRLSLLSFLFVWSVSLFPKRLGILGRTTTQSRFVPDPTLPRLCVGFNVGDLCRKVTQSGSYGTTCTEMESLECST